MEEPRGQGARLTCLLGIGCWSQRQWCREDGVHVGRLSAVTVQGAVAMGETAWQQARLQAGRPQVGGAVNATLLAASTHTAGNPNSMLIPGLFAGRCRAHSGYHAARGWAIPCLQPGERVLHWPGKASPGAPAAKVLTTELATVAG